ncbi:hypothetical protein P8452_51591 [Trifolium repens]|nr:hypothetical protein P8452_51591 [Trifolium repens]
MQKLYSIRNTYSGSLSFCAFHSKSPVASEGVSLTSRIITKQQWDVHVMNFLNHEGFEHMMNKIGGMNYQ